MNRTQLLARLEQLTQSNAEILGKLRAVHAQEAIIEERMSAGLKPVLDDKGNSLTSLNITQRVARLADELMAAGIDNPLLISVMDGALPFASELQRILAERQCRFQYATIQVSSYVGTVAGDLTVNSPPKIPVTDRNVVIVDDVCDTGATALAIKKLFISQGAQSVKTMVLVNKVQQRSCSEADPDFVGVTVPPDAFIIGTGMDYEGLLRNILGVWAVDPATLPVGDELVLLKSKKPLNAQFQENLVQIRDVERQLQSLERPEQQLASVGHSPSAMFTAAGVHRRRSSVALSQKDLGAIGDSSFQQPAAGATNSFN